MDAITLLRDDHKTVEQLFKRFEKAGDRAHVEKRQIVDRIIEELSVHAAIEEQVFYPVARATVPDTEDIALESLEEHHIVKWVLSELDGLDPTDERFDAKVTVLIENVRHHVEEEEQDFFPKVRDELGRKALADLGDALSRREEVGADPPAPSFARRAARQRRRRSDRRRGRPCRRQRQRHRAGRRDCRPGPDRQNPRQPEAEGLADRLDHRAQAGEERPSGDVGCHRRRATSGAWGTVHGHEAAGGEEGSCDEVGASSAKPAAKRAMKRAS